MRESRYSVFAGYTEQAVRDHRSDEVRHFDTKLQALNFAQWCLTDAWSISAETDSRLTFAMVTKDGECIEEFYAENH